MTITAISGRKCWGGKARLVITPETGLQPACIHPHFYFDWHSLDTQLILWHSLCHYTGKLYISIDIIVSFEWRIKTRAQSTCELAYQGRGTRSLNKPTRYKWLLKHGLRKELYPLSTTEKAFSVDSDCTHYTTSRTIHSSDVKSWKKSLSCPSRGGIFTLFENERGT